MRHSLLTLLCFLISFLAFSQDYFEQQKILPNWETGQSSPPFGYSIATWENYLAVGEQFFYGPPAYGRVTIFKYDSYQSQWIIQQDIYPNEAIIGQQFGSSVFMNDSLLAIGAPFTTLSDDEGNEINNAGAIYIFKLTSEGAWIQQEKVTLESPVDNDRFGLSCTFEGNTLISGGFEKVWILELTSPGVWEVVFNNITENNNPAGLSLNGNLLAVGAMGDPYQENDENYLAAAGAVWIFQRDEITGLWDFLQKITPADRMEQAHFGKDVKLSDDWLLIGAGGDSNDENGELITNWGDPMRGGSAYFYKPTAENVWEFEQKVIGISGEVGHDNFGWSVDIYNQNTAAISAIYDIQGGVGDTYGAVYLYELSGDEWIHTQKVIPATRSMHDDFGYDVIFTDKHLLISSPNDIVNFYDESLYSGSVYSLTKTGIHGRITRDLPDYNCDIDTLEPGIPLSTIQITPGDFVVQSSPTTGFWYMDSLPPGDYVAHIDTSNVTWGSFCDTEIPFTVTDQNILAQAVDFFLFDPDTCYAPVVSIAAPFMRPCFTDQSLYISVCNNFDATQRTDSTQLRVLLDPLMQITSASELFTETDVPGEYIFEMLPIAIGACINITASFDLSCEAILSQTICMEAAFMDVDDCIYTHMLKFPVQGAACELPYDNSHLDVQGFCQNDTVTFSVINTGEAMTCPAHVRFYRDAEILALDSVQLAANDTAHFYFAAEGATWRIEADQHPLHPGNSWPNATVELCGDLDNWIPDLVNALPVDDPNPHYDRYCGLVTGSYDPNDKTGFPQGAGTENYISPNGQMTFLIRFQNTGTDTAFTVVVRDTLHPGFDIASVTPGASSHDYTFTKYGPRVLQWTFNNILLPDSNVNEPASNGFLTFTVNQQPDLPEYTHLTNEVGIYFDYNDPIITNTTSHVIAGDLNIVSVHEHMKENSTFALYPNPTNGQFYLKFASPQSSNETRTLSIYNIQGVLITRQNLTHIDLHTININVPSGIYLVNIQSQTTSVNSKIVIVD